jgi:hypothetical protein
MAEMCENWREMELMHRQMAASFSGFLAKSKIDGNGDSGFAEKSGRLGPMKIYATRGDSIYRRK